VGSGSPPYVPNNKTRFLSDALRRSLPLPPAFPATLRQHKRRAMALPYSQFLQVFAFLHGEPVPTGSFAAPIAVSVYPC